MENKTIKMLFQVTITWYLLLVTMGLSSSEMSAVSRFKAICLQIFINWLSEVERKAMKCVKWKLISEKD